MEFSQSFKNSMFRVFNSIDYNGLNVIDSSLSLDKNNVFRKNLIVDISNDRIEIPVLARNFFENIISDNIQFSTITTIKKIILPLYDNTPVKEFKTFSNIINHLFTKMSYSQRLQRIVTYSGEEYYGGKGIILDKDFNPLLLCTLIAEKDTSSDTMIYKKAICYISPKVFLEPNNLINRGIIKKIIPFYSSNNIYCECYSYGFNSNLDRRVKIIIDNFDNFFTEPIKPTPSTCSDEILNKCLIDNIDDIMMLI